METSKLIVAKLLLGKISVNFRCTKPNWLNKQQKY